MKKTVESDCGDSSTSTGLDEDLWGSLQYHIDLAEDVYSKLPFEEFFDLRTVCKAWYVVACKRLGLKEPIHKRFFNLSRYGHKGSFDGILIYNALSRSWNWRSSWTHGHLDAFVASKGVVFSCNGYEYLRGNYASVYHWQSKIHQHLDPPPKYPRAYEHCVLGMIVSEKQGHLSSFKVVIGSPNVDTQVYESESGVWQTMPCRPPKHAMDKVMYYSKCVDCNGRVYITSQSTRVIFVYDFENAKWSSLRSPWERQFGSRHMLGVWNGRIFDMIFQFAQKEKAWAVQMWELVDETLHKWKVYDCMPKGLLSWLQSTEGFPSVDLTKYIYNHIDLSFCFCGGCMLVYSWNDIDGLVGRFCLFNIATKDWQKLNVVPGTVKYIHWDSE